MLPYSACSSHDVVFRFTQQPHPVQPFLLLTHARRRITYHHFIFFLLSSLSPPSSSQSITDGAWCPRGQMLLRVAASAAASDSAIDHRSDYSSCLRSMNEYGFAITRVAKHPANIPRNNDTLLCISCGSRVVINCRFWTISVSGTPPFRAKNI